MLQAKIHERDIIAALQYQDTNSSGLITAKQFDKAMKQCHIELSESDIQRLTLRFDVDESQQRIDIDKFTKFIRGQSYHHDDDHSKTLDGAESRVKSSRNHHRRRDIDEKEGDEGQRRRCVDRGTEFDDEVYRDGPRRQGESSSRHDSRDRGDRDRDTDRVGRRERKNHTSSIFLRQPHLLDAILSNLIRIRKERYGSLRDLNAEFIRTDSRNEGNIILPRQF